MRVIQMPTGQHGYCDFVRMILKYGELRAARGIITYDVGPTTVVIEDPTESLPLGVGRKISRAVAAVEAMQLIGGFSSPELIIAASKNFAQFTEPDGRFHGAYGIRVGTQLIDVVNKLKADSGTRQAVITLWDPLLDNTAGKKDYPCTVALGFAIKNGTSLELNVVMRSQDVWLGAPYDWFQFTQLQQTVAHVLGIEPGVYRHTTWSTHLYQSNVDRVAELSWSFDAQPQPSGFNGAATIEECMKRARDLGRLAIQTSDTVPNDLTTSEKWYREWTATLLG